MTVETYIRRIRHPAKRDFAVRYAAWVRAGSEGDSPDSTISPMARQGVRWAINEILTGSMWGNP